MNASWYAWYPSDYQRDTGYLSLLEHGAYRTLLDAYYCNGSLPADLDRLLRLTLAFSAEERKAVEKVVGEFFRVDGDRLRHERADREIGRREEFRAERSATGRRGAAVRWHGSANGSGYGCSMASPQPQTTTASARKRAEQVSRIYADADFAQFWDAYPRKKDKVAAATAWANVADSPETNAIVSAIQRQCETADWKREGGKFVPYPATWLNHHRWEDEIPEVTREEQIIY